MSNKIENDVWHNFEVENLDNVSSWFEFTDHEEIPEEYHGFPIKLPHWFGLHIDFETGRWTCNDELGKDYPDLNELASQKKLVRRHAYKEYDIDLGYDFELNRRNLREIMQEFKDNGFDVTKEAIEHNYHAWALDMKSGYRDEVNGYHLFSACGCNPFALRLTTLVSTPDVDWQTTYIC